MLKMTKNSNKALCRVCLAGDVRLFSIINTPLQDIYEKITNIPLSFEESGPVQACFICRAHLKTCHKLMTKAKNADHILKGTVLQSNNEHIPASVDQQCYLEDFCVTPIECFSTIPDNHDDENNLKSGNDAMVKIENVVKNVKQEVQVEEEYLQENCEGSVADYNNECDGIKSADCSDSEDDIPLQAISNKNTSRTNIVNAKVKKKRPHKNTKREKGFKCNFAKEIILSKDQQLRELRERSKSLNYLNSPLRCEACYKGFVDARAYDNHTKKHDECSGSFECDICRMRYRTARQLRTHALTAHSRRYQCARCAHRSHTANQAREHEKWHSGYTYECKLCGQTFRKPTSYLTHMRKRHPTQHVCDMCGDSFVGRHGLLMHKSKTHRDDKVEDSSSPSERFCAECKVQFASVDAWKRHILTSHKHTLRGPEDSPVCKICSAEFPSPSALVVHLRQHEKSLRAARSGPVASKGAKLACDQCDSNFVNRSKLQAHVRRKHLGLKYNKNIVCEVCGKKCTSNASLKYHQRTHTGEKPYQCGECSKQFTDKNQLRIHTRTHTGERPYCCTVCGKRFSQKPALNRHYRVHTGAKPYTCQFCSKPFSQSNSLSLHVRSVHLKMPPARRRQTDGQTDTQASGQTDGQQI